MNYNGTFCQLKDCIILLRPEQWIKNTFVFLPAFFGGYLLEPISFLQSLFVFLSFSLAASGIYCLNDISDVNNDKNHCAKKNRPIASGRLSKRTGFYLCIICFSTSFFWIWGISSLLYNYRGVAIVTLSYLLLNILYCFFVKNIAIVDLISIAIGFVLRVGAGGFASGIYLSHWIIMMTFLLALFIALGKRRDDVLVYSNSGVMNRKNVNRYNIEFMNQSLSFVAGITMISYILYTVSPEVINRFKSENVYLTSVFVLAGMLRYMQVSVVDIKSASPTRLVLKDRFIQVCIVGWLTLFAIIIYV